MQIFNGRHFKVKQYMKFIWIGIFNEKIDFFFCFFYDVFNWFWFIWICWDVMGIEFIIALASEFWLLRISSFVRMLIDWNCSVESIFRSWEILKLQKQFSRYLRVVNSSWFALVGSQITIEISSNVLLNICRYDAFHAKSWSRPNSKIKSIAKPMTQ